MKKSTCFILAMILAFGNASPTLASQKNINTEEKDLVDNLPIVIMGNDEYSLKNYDTPTQYEGINRSQDGCYALEINTTKGKEYVPVGKLDIDLTNVAEVDSIISNEKIEEEVKKSILDLHQEILNENISCEKVTLFSSQLLQSSAPGTRSTYYTYQGAQMKSDRLVSTGLNTKYKTVKNGTGTKNVANGISQVILTVLSSNKYINFFSNGINLLQAFNDVFGTTWATGSTSDYLQVRLIYDDIKQWTYRKMGNEWRLGLCTQKSTVTNIASEQYYFNSAKNAGKTLARNRNVSVVHKSPHFDSPWATAYQWVTSPLTEWVSWKCGSVTFSF